MIVIPLYMAVMTDGTLCQLVSLLSNAISPEIISSFFVSSIPMPSWKAVKEEEEVVGVKNIYCIERANNVKYHRFSLQVLLASA